MSNHRRVVLSVDPGTRNTGWAKFYEQKKSGWVKLDSGVIETPVTRSAFEQIFQIREILRRKMLALPRVTELWIEAYTPFGPNKKANAQGILQGALYGLYDSLKFRKESNVRIIQPSVWKPWIANSKFIEQGVVDFARKLNVVDCYNESGTEHETDAIGLGLFAIAKGLKYEGSTR